MRPIDQFVVHERFVILVFTKEKIQTSVKSIAMVKIKMLKCDSLVCAKNCIRSYVFFGKPVSMAFHPSQMRKRMVENKMMPNQLSALAAPLLKFSILPAAIVDSGIRNGIRKAWFFVAQEEVRINADTKKIIGN